MSNVLTKQVQNKIIRYFLKLSNHLSKPESRCVREMTTGILKSGTVLVNKIATGICDSISLSQTTKRFRNHYNKVVHFSKDQEMTPLFNKLYSFDHGAKSENKEIMEAIQEVDAIIDKDVTKIFDRGMDRPICRDFIIAEQGNFILRLKKTTKLIYNGKETPVNKISRKMPLFMELTAIKTKKNKKHKVTFMGGAVKVKYKIKGKVYDLWLVVTKRKDGGYCWLLTRSPKEGIIDIIKEAFTAYGFRWKIEEYHRHIKSCYNLEDIQVKTFEGLQSMLAILTIAMNIIYSSLSGLHTKLLLQSGIKTLNKEKISELRNFIYYKISAIIKVMLANMTPRAFLPPNEISQDDGQLRLTLNYEY